MADVEDSEEHVDFRVRDTQVLIHLAAHKQVT